MAGFCLPFLLCKNDIPGIIESNNKKETVWMFKKIIKVVFAVLIVITVGLVGVSFFTPKDKDAVTDERLSQIMAEDHFLSNPYSGFSQLKEDERKAYLRLTDKLDNYESTVELGDNKISVDSLNRVWTAIQQDKPEYFWLDSYTYHYDQETSMVTDVSFNYHYNTDEIKRRQGEIDAAVTQIKSGITPEMDDYTKVKTVHDAIVSHTEYDLNSEDNQNICSVFLNNRSVCAGYSKALQYVLKDIGIFSNYVTGNAVGRGPHAWNLVQMDGEYYYVDATWDDPSFDDITWEDPALRADPPLNIEYVYFGLTTEELLKNHTFDNTLSTYPGFTATADNYYVRENMLFDLNSADEQTRFLDTLRGTLDNGSVMEARFTEPGMMDRALAGIEESDILNESGVRYLRYDENQVLIIWRP